MITIFILFKLLPYFINYSFYKKNHLNYFNIDNDLIYNNELVLTL